MAGGYWTRFRKWFGEGKNWRKVVVPLAVVAVLFVLGRLIEVDKYLQILQRWMGGMGPWGPVAFVGIYIGAMLLLMPGTPFTLAAAFLFGTWKAFFVMVAASTLAAVLGFLIARHGARKSLEERFADKSKFDKLRKMVEKNHRIAIPFVRLMPFFPFAINNYALGLTRISFWTYLFYSELVFLPMNAVLVFGAYALYQAAVVGETPWMLIGITVGAGFLILGLGYAGKRAFGGEERPEEK